jgi:lipopolysaccharide transport system ATP-binding protein
VGSLLEVGTGFHPELTGRENLYLNGAILGMRRAEITHKFDEIVAFAEIEKFIDTPVKHYSSGMYMRLAFAVAAHLEPEILVVDEVLAVGDLAFQKKCLGKMGDVAKGGKTIIFVTHQLNQIRRLCQRSLWLDNGRLRSFGRTDVVLASYESDVPDNVTHEMSPDSKRKKAQFLRWDIVEPNSEHPNVLSSSGPVTIRVVASVRMPLQRCTHGVNLWDRDGRVLWGWRKNDLYLEEGIHEFIYNLESLPVRPGSYTLNTSLFDEDGVVDIWFGVPEVIVATDHRACADDFWGGVLNIGCDFEVRSAANSRHFLTNEHTTQNYSL